MAGFVQIIEFRTTRIEEVQRLAEEMGASGAGAAVRGTVTRDLDRPDVYLNIVEFDSHESAMANSSRPEVSAFAASLAALCDGPPRFYNLEVVDSWSSAPSPSTTAAVATAATALAGAAAAGLTKARQRWQDRKAPQGSERATSSVTTAPVTPPPVASPTETATDSGRPSAPPLPPTPPTAY